MCPCYLENSNKSNSHSEKIALNAELLLFTELLRDQSRMCKGVGGHRVIGESIFDSEIGRERM